MNDSQQDPVEVLPSQVNGLTVTGTKVIKNMAAGSEVAQMTTI